MKKVCFINENFVEAATWFHKAAELELADAEVYLSVCYLLGLGVKQDEAEAIKWLLHVAEMNEKDSSLWRIGLCDEKGLGISQDEIELSNWAHRTTVQGYHRTCYNLGEHRAYDRKLATDVVMLLR